ADSIARSTYIKRSGPYSAEKKRMATIWDWTQTECYDRIADAGLRLPVDYEWFKRNGRKNSGRSFDGIAHQFTRALAIHAPDDYAVLKEWFPLVDLDHYRHEEITNAVDFLEPPAATAATAAPPPSVRSAYQTAPPVSRECATA